MCLYIFVGRKAVDRYWEWKRAGRENRKKFVQKILPCFRPAVSGDQHEASNQTYHYIEDGKLLLYVSETSLSLTKEVPK
jgi:hypothetical protein